MVGSYLYYDCVLIAVLGYAEHSQQTVKDPYSAGCDLPVVVEVVAPPEDDAVPAADDDQYCKDNMQKQEGFVCKASEVDVAQDEHRTGQYGSDDAP